MRRLLIAVSVLAAAATLVPVDRGGAAVGDPALLVIDGEAGDGPSHGRHLQLAAVYEGLRGAEIQTFSHDSVEHQYAFWLAPPAGERLEVGLYTGAQRAGFRQAGLPGLDLYGDAAGCNSYDATFRVDDVAYSATGELDRLAARYEAHCDGGEHAAFGSIMHRTTVVEPMRTVTPHAINFGEVTARETQSIIVRNSGSVPVVVDRLLMSTSVFEIVTDGCSGASLAAGRTCVIDVATQPAVKGGAQRGYLEIFDNTTPTSTRGYRVVLAASLATRPIFRMVAGRAPRYSVPVVADLDGDGAQDVAWWNGAPNSRDPVWFSRGQGSFVTARNFDVPVAEGYWLVRGRFNGDSRDDLLLYGIGTRPDFVLRGRDRNGWAAAPIPQIGGDLFPIAGDFDGNGVTDIVFYNNRGDRDTVWLFRARGTVRQTTAAIGSRYNWFTVGDFDGNRRDELLFGYRDGARAARTSNTISGFRSRLVNSVPGAFPFAAQFDDDPAEDLLWFGPGSAADGIVYNGEWGVLTRITAAGNVEPLVANFTADNATHSDVLWWAISSASDRFSIGGPPDGLTAVPYEHAHIDWRSNLAGIARFQSPRHSNGADVLYVNPLTGAVVVALSIDRDGATAPTGLALNPTDRDRGIPAARGSVHRLDGPARLPGGR